MLLVCFLCTASSRQLKSTPLLPCSVLWRLSLNKTRLRDQGQRRQKENKKDINDIKRKFDKIWHPLTLIWHILTSFQEFDKTETFEAPFEVYPSRSSLSCHRGPGGDFQRSDQKAYGSAPLLGSEIADPEGGSFILFGSFLLQLICIIYALMLYSRIFTYNIKKEFTCLLDQVC